MCVLLDINDERKNAEIGYWIIPGARRQGIAYNAYSLVIEFAFTELQLHKVWAETFKTNKPSQGLLKKRGFRKGRIQKQEVFKHGKWQDRVRHELLQV